MSFFNGYGNYMPAWSTLSCVSILQAAGGAMLGLGIYFRVSDDANAIVEIAGVTFYYAGIYCIGETRPIGLHRLCLMVTARIAKVCL